MNTFPILTLNSAEAIFAPFYDPEISASFEATLKPGAGVGCRWSQVWCAVILEWEGTRPGEIAVEAILEGRIRREFYDHFIFTLNVPLEIDVRFQVKAGETWCPLTDWQSGAGKTMEITAPIPEGEINGITLQARSSSPGKSVLAIGWFGLGSKAALPIVTRQVVPLDAAWSGLIDFPDSWPEQPDFWSGLLFDAAALPELRRKLEQPGWKEYFATIEDRARKNLDMVPEKWIGEFVPWTPISFLRVREQGAIALFDEALIMGFVGLIRRDRDLALMGLRCLMTIVHTTHWCISAQHRLRGSTWDQRCFSQEIYGATVALLADWYAWALTPRARSLIAQSLWDKSLAVIERDLMKFEYVHHINQGPWFCRARILGGLLLEKAWPRVGSYVDRAHAEMMAGLDNYLLADGGIDEGIGYFWLTLETTIPASFAYAKARKLEPATLLPEKVHRSEKFVTALSSMRPGHFLLDGDNSDERVISDAPAVMARYFPEQIYSNVLAASLETNRKEAHVAKEFGTGVFTCIFGPEKLPVPRSIVPEFALLPQTGHLTSLRRVDGHTVRIHFVGAKANASHTHYDKGNVTLEIDSLRFLIDRGTLRYEDIRSVMMKNTSLHNVITPMTGEGFFLPQSLVTEATIPQGHGDAVKLEARIDLANVWRDHMSGCTRKLRSSHPLQFTIEDAGELKNENRVAFHLQALEPFQVEGRKARLEREGIVLEIEGDWVREIRHHEDTVDYAQHPIWHLTLISEPMRRFALQTCFTIYFK